MVIAPEIYGEWNDDPNQFSYSYRNIDKRIKTNANVLWENLPARSAGDKLITGDLSPIVEEITRLNGWDSGNSMVFLIDPLAAGGVHSVQSYNGNPASAPKLLIQYQSVVQPTTEPPSYITARDLLLTELDNMDTSGGTPIVGAYHEAAQYFLGGGVDYGTHRGLGASNRRHRVSHPLSYAGGQVFRHSDCTDSDILNSDCISETINGNARYISPMESSCQTNHIVLLSDGQATNSGDAVSRVQNTISSNCDHQSNAGETCGTELAHWLATNDHSPQIRNEQKIKTYTIGFAADLPFLERIASHGEGRYFQASSSAQLVSSFEDILDDVYSVDTSFVAPGLR